MVVIKSTFLLLTVAAFSAIVPVASTTSLVVEVETKKNDPEPGRPKNPLFACEIKSRTCRSTSNYTGLRLDPLNLDLSVCYDPNFVKDVYNWVSLSNKRGLFINTFYVSCPEKDHECSWKVKGKSADDIRNVVEDSINEQTDCVASARCWDMEGVDKHCYKKH